jgi:hypothetical protein
MSIYSINRGKFCDQMDRPAMQSPLVPIIDNVCKEHCVQWALSISTQNPFYRYRYVNEIFCCLVLWHGRTASIQTSGSQCIERERESIACLVVLRMRTPDALMGQFAGSHTYWYIPACQFHHLSLQKCGIFSTLIQRAKTICNPKF